MNIKDSYLHGGSHVVKNINFLIAASGINQNKLVATITWAEEGSSDTELAIPISGATFGSLTKNTVFAAPNGSNGIPSFRTLVAADIPNISANKITSDTLGADRLPLATNSAKGAVILGVAKTSDADSAITGKKYWVKMNASGKLFIDVPWNDNTHYTAVPILGGIDATSNATSDTANDATYLNIIENNAKSGGIKIIGSGATTVKANGGVLTINSTNSTYTVNNGTYSIKSKIGSTTTTLSDFTANQSGTDDFTLIQGSNITFTNDATNRTLTIAGTANTTYTLKIGTSASASNIVTLLSGTSTTSGTIITNTAYNASSNKIATMTDVNNAVTSMFKFQNNTDALPTGTQKVGYAYRVSTAFTLAAANSASGADEVLEVGDLIICTDATTPKYLALNTNWTVTNSAPTLGTTAKTIATIGGVAITASLPTASRSGSTVTAGIITPTTSGTKKFLREDGTWAAPSYTTDTVRPIYSGGTSRFTSSLKTAINFVGAGATSVTFLAAGTGEGQSGNASYANIKISSNNDLVKFSAITTNTEYYLPVRAKNTTDTAQLLYRTSIIVKDSTITATLSGNASTATNLSKTSGTNRGYLYLSANATTACTGVGSVTAVADIGIPYVGYANNANTYGIYKDLFYLSGTAKYIGNDVRSNKFACVKSKDSVTDDWTGSSTSGQQSGSGTTYSAGDGISINNGVISSTRREWYGTEAQFNSLPSLDNNTTYYIMAT